MKFLSLILVLLILGCMSEPLSTSSSDNSEIKYDYLFTIKEENIRIYRFRDGGSVCYISVKGNQAEVSFDIPKGKTKELNTVQTLESK